MPFENFEYYTPANLPIDDWIVRSRATVIDVDGVEYWPTYPGNFSSIQVQREVNFHSFGKLPYGTCYNPLGQVVLHNPRYKGVRSSAYTQERCIDFLHVLTLGLAPY